MRHSPKQIYFYEQHRYFAFEILIFVKNSDECWKETGCKNGYLKFTYI